MPTVFDGGARRCLGVRFIQVSRSFADLIPELNLTQRGLGMRARLRRRVGTDRAMSNSALDDDSAESNDLAGERNSNIAYAGRQLEDVLRLETDDADLHGGQLCLAR